MKTMRGQDSVVLYLDYDGVLHHEDVWWHPRRGAFIKTHGYELFEHISLLEQALGPFPEVQIVLSTSWVRVRRYSRAVKRLTPALRERVVGATFHTRMNRDAFEALPRGIQVLNDVIRRKPRQWLAIDDDAEGWPSEYRKNLIHTDPTLGLSTAGTLEQLHKCLTCTHSKT